MSGMNPKMLGHIRVLDLSLFLSGPYGSQILADMGAQVIKVEPGGGDMTRQLPPNFIAGDSAYFHGFEEIGRKLSPEIALLPIGAYHPETFRKVHMGPDEAVKAFKDLRAKILVPMHYGTFKLSFEAMDEPPRWLKEIAAQQNMMKRLKIPIKSAKGKTIIFC